ncbi:MAG: DUF4405 domain-containing protein [Rhodospirillales bacterium]|nr:DUF4405 domain-containing protein [Rhodospirillales bacterium]
MMSPAQVVTFPVARPFHKRGWVVFVLGLSATILLISGIVLFIAPSGRIASATHWALLWLDKDGWVNLHNVFAILFVAGLIWHFVFNWKPLRNYVINRATHHLNLKREMLAAAAVLLVLVVLVAQDLPPVDALTDLSAYFRHRFWN